MGVAKRAIGSKVKVHAACTSCQLDTTSFACLFEEEGEHGVSSGVSRVAPPADYERA